MENYTTARKQVPHLHLHLVAWKAQSYPINSGTRGVRALPRCHSCPDYLLNPSIRAAMLAAPNEFPLLTKWDGESSLQICIAENPGKLEGWMNQKQDMLCETGCVQSSQNPNRSHNIVPAWHCHPTHNSHHHCFWLENQEKAPKLCFSTA